MSFEGEFREYLTEFDRARFWSQVSVTRDAGVCWPWVGTLNDSGYGRFTTDSGQELRAHRVAYALLVEDPPADLTLDHLCRVRQCCNPKHLELCSIGENVLRGMGGSAQRARQTECKYGHPFTEKNTYVTKQGHRQCRLCDARRHRKST